MHPHTVLQNQIGNIQRQWQRNRGSIHSLSKRPRLRCLLENQNNKGSLQKTHWRSSTSGRKFGDSTTADHKVLNEGCESRDNHRYAVVLQDLAARWMAREIRTCVYVDDIKLAGKKQYINPTWKVLNKEVDLGEPTSFLDHVYLGCTQRHCEISKDIVDNCRTMLESRISAGATEKLPYSENLSISSWSYDMEGHANPLPLLFPCLCLCVSVCVFLVVFGASAMKSECLDMCICNRQ